MYDMDDDDDVEEEKKRCNRKQGTKRRTNHMKIEKKI